MGHALISTIIFILNLVTGGVIALILLRGLMQYTRTNFLNSAAQVILKITNPVILPLRKVLPSMGRIDTASFISAFLIHVVFILVLALLQQQTTNIFLIIIWSIAGILATLLNIYSFMILCSMIASWVRLEHDIRFQSALHIINKISGPVLRIFQSKMFSLSNIDFSPIIPLLIIEIVLHFLNSTPFLYHTYIIGL
jgi:YggT family protein